MISRPNILMNALEWYSQRDLHLHMLHISFNGEAGEDFQGLSREFFTSFWEACLDAYFFGRRILYPRVGPYDMNPPFQTWRLIGMIFSHGFIVVNYIPLTINEASLYFLLTGRQPAPRVLINSFLSTLAERDELTLTTAISTNPSLTEFPETLMTRLSAITCHFGATSIPRPNNIRSIITSIARYSLIEGNFFALHYMREGMTSAHPTLWSPPPSDENVFSLLNSYTPTAELIISRLQVDLSEDPIQYALETQIVDWFHQFLFTLTALQLAILLRFITSSNILNGFIKVTFNGTQNEINMLHVATCGRQITFSRYIMSFESLETFLLNVLSNPHLWNTFDTV